MLDVEQVNQLRGYLPYYKTESNWIIAGYPVRQFEPIELFDTEPGLLSGTQSLTIDEAAHLKPLIIEPEVPTDYVLERRGHKGSRHREGLTKLILSPEFVYRVPEVGPRRTLDELEEDQIKEPTP